MKKYLLLIFVGFVCIPAFSQEGSGEDWNNFQSRNAFYLEIGGTALSASINYERRYIRSEMFRYGFRIGYGFHFTGLTFGPRPDPGTMIPLAVMATYGKSAHQLEAGIGTSLLINQGFKSTGNTQYPTIEGKVKIVGTGQFGYRIHPHIDGVMARLVYTPMLFFLNSSELKLDHWVGVSIGWALPNHKVK